MRFASHNGSSKTVSAHHAIALRVTTLLSRIALTFREHLLSGFSWNVVSAVAMQGSVLLSTIIVARLLGLESFGIYSLLVATVMTVAAVAQGGSGVVATKLVGEFLASGPERVGRLLKTLRIFALSMGTCAALLLFSSAQILSADVFVRPELIHPIRLVAVATFFFAFASYQIGALQGFGAFREMSRASVVTGLCLIFLTSIGAILNQVTGALLGFVFASAIRAVMFGYALNGVRRANGVPTSVAMDFQDFRLIWRFALPSGLAGLVTVPCLWLVTVILARLPEGLSLVAVFSAAHQMRLTVLQLPSLLNAVSFSALSQLKGRNEIGGYRGIFWSNLAINAGFSTVAIIVLIALSEPLLHLYGPEFGAGKWLLVILLISVVPESLAMSSYQLIQSAGRMWYSLFAIVIPRDLTYLTLSVVLISQLGLLGAGLSYLIAWVGALLLIFISVRKRFYG